MIVILSTWLSFLIYSVHNVTIKSVNCATTNTVSMHHPYDHCCVVYLIYQLTKKTGKCLCSSAPAASAPALPDFSLCCSERGAWSHDPDNGLRSPPPQHFLCWGPGGWGVGGGESLHNQHMTCHHRSCVIVRNVTVGTIVPGFDPFGMC